MPLLLILLFISFYILKSSYGNLKESENSEQLNKIDACKPHNWSYNKDNLLECLDCGFISGSHKTDNGEYE